MPEFTNEFGSKPEETSGGSEESGSSDTGETSEPDLPEEEPTCDLIEGEACPPGEGLKCVPAGELEGFECVELDGDGQLGDPCSHDVQSNTDSCGAESYCFQGACHQLCGAGAACPGLGACWEPSWVCIQGCDPLAQDCPGALACMWTQDMFYGFQCGPAVGLSEGAACSGSIYDSPCGPGLGCVPELLYPGGCGAPLGAGCCSPLCDLEDGPGACAQQGTSCIPAELPSVPSLGACGGVSFSPGDIVITEIYANPPGIPIYEAPFEYVEILNNSGHDIELGQLSIDDFVGGGPDNMLERFSVVAGSGGCQGGSSGCLAPGRRALFVSQLYEIETNGALVLAADNLQIFDTILQPWSRLEVFEATTDTVISTYREWPDPTIEPLPNNELPMHRVDLQGADVPENWAELPPSPGL